MIESFIVYRNGMAVTLCPVRNVRDTTHKRDKYAKLKVLIECIFNVSMIGNVLLTFG